MTNRKTFNKFKLLCPHSNEPFIDTADNAARWIKHILHIEKLQIQMANNPAIERNEKDVQAYEAASRRRKFKSFDDIPEYIKERLGVHREAILKTYPNTKEIYLTGSYARGNYIDSRTVESFKAKKHKVKGDKRTKISDFDYVLVPGIDSLSVNLGTSIHLLNERGETKLLIWQAE